MQFGGPTPEDLGPNDLNIVTSPPPREVAGKVLPSEYQRMVRDMVEGLDPPRLGLGHSPLEVIVTPNRETGRVALPDAKTDPVQITSPTVPPKPRAELAHELLIRARKRDFLQRPDTPAIVKKDPSDRSEDKIERIKITLAPKPDVVLIDRSARRRQRRTEIRRTVRHNRH
jgi:hypothetical protein